MKNLSILLVLFLVSCNKEIMQTQQTQRVGGLIEDKPNNVPIRVSASFAKITTAIRTSEIAGRGKVDKAAPTVSFTYPLTNTNVSGTVNIVVYTKDNVGVTSKGILIAGKQVSTTSTYSWNTTGLPSGYYTLIAWAQDAAGNRAQTSITVSIKTVVVEPPVDPEPVTGKQITMPPVQNQGGEGSCVAFAVGYNARSVEWHNTNKELVTFSPEHLFNQVKFPGGCNVGTAMQTALEFIMGNGILPWAAMPYDATNGCDLGPTDVQKQQAFTYKIDGYFKMYTTDTGMIKGMIRQNKPVIISILADNYFMNAKEDFIWNSYSGSGSVGHCVVIKGYDDGRQAYRIMNSWGENWGGKGECWLGYEFFPTRSGTYCYAIK